MCLLTGRVVAVACPVTCHPHHMEDCTSVHCVLVDAVDLAVFVDLCNLLFTFCTIVLRAAVYLYCWAGRSILQNS